MRERQIDWQHKSSDKRTHRKEVSGRERREKERERQRDRERKREKEVLLCTCKMNMSVQATSISKPDSRFLDDRTVQSKGMKTSQTRECVVFVMDSYFSHGSWCYCSKNILLLLVKNLVSTTLVLKYYSLVSHVGWNEGRNWCSFYSLGTKRGRIKGRNQRAALMSCISHQEVVPPLLVSSSNLVWRRRRLRSMSISSPCFQWRYFASYFYLLFLITVKDDDDQ